MPSPSGLWDRGHRVGHRSSDTPGPLSVAVRTVDCGDIVTPGGSLLASGCLKEDLDESIRFYSETLGLSLKFRDGGHYAALDGGSVTLALATAVDHPLPGKVVVGIKTADVDAAAKAIEESGGAIVKGPYNDAHERRAVVYDNKGNGLVFYSPLPR
jgi:lactoylglutathione lyase